MGNEKKNAEKGALHNVNAKEKFEIYSPARVLLKIPRAHSAHRKLPEGVFCTVTRRSFA